MSIDRQNDSLYNQVMKKYTIFIILFLQSFFFVFSPQAQAESSESVFEQQKKIVKAVEINGNKSIGISKIRSKIKTRIGQEYLENVISSDIKRLYNTGYFSDVSVDRKDYEGGFKVIFFVEEKPLIKSITFSKIHYFSPRKLSRKIKTQKDKFFDNKNLKDDLRTIKELYSKKGLTSVVIDVEKDVDKLHNEINLHFVIKEGIRVQIKKIFVKGNYAYRDKKILKVIKTRPDTLFSSGFLKEEILEEDMARIKSFYEEKGFIDVKVSYEYATITENLLNVTIQISEGKKYFVESILITGNNVLSQKDILAAMKEIRTGTVFSRDKLSEDISHIRSFYFDKGYIYANVQESTSLNADTGEVDIKLDISEGILAYVNKIIVQGNTRTRDIVIRRELRLYPGDRFDGQKLRRSKQRLTNLGYFEDISYDIEDSDSLDKKDLVVMVKEAKTGSFSFGGGYSTIDEVVGFVEVQQKNFDFTNWPTFTGGGQNLQLRAETGSTRNNMRLSFTEPWLFDYPISAGFDVYRTERERERDVGYAYDEKRKGVNLRLGKQFTEFVSGGVSYRLEDIEIGNFEEPVSNDLRAEEGDNRVSSVGLSLSYDKRDNSLSPSRGFFVRGGVDVAGGALGGDKDFARLSANMSYYIPLKYRSVLEFRMRSGIIDAYGEYDDSIGHQRVVPIFERFFVGGSRTIRGYNERKVGPLDPVTGDPVGGESMLVGNIEYTIPVIEFIKLAAFFDIGNVWAKREDLGAGGYKSGAGMGLRVKTPIGPINLDYGYPLNSEDGETERSGKITFSVSRGF